MKIQENNFAFIDSQNLNLGVKGLGWDLDFKKFRRYLKEKYNVSNAFLFIGFIPKNKEMYSSLKNCGYTLIFKPVIPDENGKPKGNVDADLVLNTMKEWNNYDKAIIVSSDGDFYSLVDYLFEKNKLKVVISSCCETCSCLLKRYSRGMTAYLNNMKEKLEYKKRARY
jgi:uncharacterized LabA/DUF88 family protein